MIPTGMPTREVVLQVTAESGGLTRTQTRVYRKVVGDEKGQILEADHEALLKGALILGDNRIAPRERRIERFNFPFRDSKTAKITATLAYRYSPRLVKVQEMNVQLGQVQRFIQ